MNPRPRKRTLRVGAARFGFSRRASAATRLPADTTFVVLPRSASVSVNGRSPRCRYGASTLPRTSPCSSAVTVASVMPSSITSTLAPGVNPDASIWIGSRSSTATER
jgi:hypothetical protein